MTVRIDKHQNSKRGKYLRKHPIAPKSVKSSKWQFGNVGTKFHLDMKMPVDELPTVNPDVDYKQILPIQQKRTIAFVNHFIMNWISYLNHFAQSCESRFMEFEYKVQKLEASLLILESQLSSITGLKSLNTVQKTNNITDSAVLEINSNLDIEPTMANLQLLKGSNDGDDIKGKSEIGLKARDDPRYKKFFKMLQVRIPEEAVKLQMKSEGVDPDILKNNDLWKRCLS
ncbi:WASH complex subunit 3 isoform X2 [Cylas formicarius]|uniref:WASH complex subunit 3 isoform X2 n=1 Tax=Cylas formicarius TaxID=197179 RepID=UPI0029585745|nr:WASH complex subunit 3 isoform X2 [Cylas formicarius]